MSGRTGTVSLPPSDGRNGSCHIMPSPVPRLAVFRYMALHSL